MNGKYIDLHPHSIASDGTDDPARLPELAAELGLAAVALTDHDTVAGLAEFLASGGKYPEVEAVPGVEISCSYSCREIHLVGLFVDHRSAALTRFLERRREDRVRRNREMMAKLRTLGFELSWDDPEFEKRGPRKQLMTRFNSGSRDFTASLSDCPFFRASSSSASSSRNTVGKQSFCSFGYHSGILNTFIFICSTPFFYKSSSLNSGSRGGFRNNRIFRKITM